MKVKIIDGKDGWFDNVENVTRVNIINGKITILHIDTCPCCKHEHDVVTDVPKDYDVEIRP